VMRDAFERKKERKMRCVLCFVLDFFQTLKAVPRMP
jgi:hypothetical protein